MKYATGTFVTFDNVELSQDDKYNMYFSQFDYENINFAVKIGVYDFLAYSKYGAYKVETYIKANKIIDMGNAHLPENVGLSVFPTEVNKDYCKSVGSMSLPEKVGSVLYVEPDYLEKITGFKATNVYRGTTPALVIDDYTIMVLNEKQGTVLTLPVLVHTLLKHSKFYSTLSVDEFVFTD